MVALPDNLTQAFPLSKKQFEVVATSLPSNDKRVTVSVGTRKSGKTHSHPIALCLSMATTEKPSTAFISAKTYSHITREILPHIENFARLFGIPHGWSRQTYRFGPHEILFKAGEDISSKTRFHGGNFAWVLVDEAQLIPDPEFVPHAIACCSDDPGLIWLMCNPEDPDNVIKTKYVDDSNNRLFEFHFEDNPSLSEDYVELLKRQWHPESHYYKRYIECIWAAADGLVYPSFKTGSFNDFTPEITRLYIDYGVSVSKMGFAVLKRDSNKKIHSPFSETMDPNQDLPNPSDVEIAKRSLDIYDEWNCSHICVDPGGGGVGLRNELRRQRPNLSFRKPRKDKDIGYRRVENLFATGDLLLESGTSLTKSIPSFKWHPKNELEAMKEPDDCAAFRYGVMDLSPPNKKVGFI